MCGAKCVLWSLFSESVWDGLAEASTFAYLYRHASDGKQQCVLMVVLAFSSGMRLNHRDRSNSMRNKSSLLSRSWPPCGLRCHTEPGGPIQRQFVGKEVAPCPSPYLRAGKLPGCTSSRALSAPKDAPPDRRTGGDPGREPSEREFPHSEEG